MKSVLQPRIRDFVAWQLEHYHDNKRQLEEIKRDMVPSPTPTYGGSGSHSNEAHRATEDVAMQICSSAYLRNLEQTVRAIDYVLSKLDETDMKLLSLVYFKGTCTVAGAAQIVNLSQSGAYKRIQNMMIAIALELGLINDGY